MNRILFFITLAFLSACTQAPEQEEQHTEQTMQTLQEGTWQARLQLDSQTTLPFNFDYSTTEGLRIRNAEEEILIRDLQWQGAELRLDLPVFNSEIIASLNTEGQLVGKWWYYDKEDYALDFRAVPNTTYRFAPKNTRLVTDDLAKRYKVTFSPGEEGEYVAIGYFEHKEGGKVEGTFLTETGDYRYLEGDYIGNKLRLSCFDGAHAFLFMAERDEDTLRGTFYSGKHWKTSWVAVVDEEFKLAKMDTLTKLKSGYEGLSFSLPNEQGEMISLEDERFAQKVCIVQILGTWCPNCMDETRFLVEMHKKYHNKGLEIIGIDFERRDDRDLFKRNMAKARKDLVIPYPVVFGGKANKKEAVKQLPMLEHILSYPTAVFIDKAGKVRKIHTGFSGPGTGDLYTEYCRETEALLEQLLAE